MHAGCVILKFYWLHGKPTLFELSRILYLSSVYFLETRTIWSYCYQYIYLISSLITNSILSVFSSTADSIGRFYICQINILSAKLIYSPHIYFTFFSFLTLYILASYVNNSDSTVWKVCLPSLPILSTSSTT